ncbi:TPA: autotransporter outer membrane beta-barrel domain-containing protein [Campylobacter jejuni]|nr:autotransporter outer membrane beta-barrel domain-containing protein [Campylobacter jejuni]
MSHGWGGGIEKNQSSSKKLVLSLVTISFLASYANATLTPEIKTYDEANKNVKARSASVYQNTNTTVSGSETNTINISNQGSHSITIEKNGTLGNENNNNKIIYVHAGNSDTLTLTNLTNNGTINGKVAVENSSRNFTGTITVNTFENKNQINGDIYMGLWGNSQGTINIDKFGNSGTITASNKKGVYFEGNTNIKTFNNSGFISGIQGVDLSRGTIISFSNSGTISSKTNEAIYLSNTTIGSFNNTGTISSNSTDNTNGIQGVSITQTTIENFANSGTIQSKGNKNMSNNSSLGVSSGLYLCNSAYIKTFTNTGLISGKFGIGLIGSTIGNFTNKGTIESTSNHSYSGAFYLNSLTVYGKHMHSVIQTLTNEGVIKSTNSNGISLGASNKVETFINKGTIDAGANGINFFTFFGYINQPTGVDKIILESGSIIKAGNNGINIDNGGSTGAVLSSDSIEVKQGAVVEGGNSGIYIGGGKEIDTQITISGSVTGGTAGIVNEGVIGGSSSSEDSSTGGIIISGGSVSSSSGGSGIVNQGNGSITGEIKVESGGSVEGGITNTGSGSISGSIVVESGGKLDSITNTSTLSTGISGSITNNSDNKLEISNSGNIGGKIESTGSADMVISNSNGGTISGGISSSGSGSTSISNSQGSTINNGITVSGSAQVEISNQGSVGKDSNGNTVTNNGSGSVGIKDWLVSTDKNTGKLNTVVIGGSGKDNVKVENIAVDQSNVDLEELNDINNIISGVNQNNIGNIGTNGGGEISLSYDPLTGKLTTDFNLNASISGATFRSLISTTSRRSTFIDNVMGNSMQSFALASSSKSQSIAMSEKGNLYADASDYIKSDLNNGSYGSNKEHSLFILPYTSSQNVELSLNEESKGHTKGTIIGYSTLKDSGIYGIYAGYEDTKMNSTYFNINNRTYYAGLKYFNTLFTTKKGQEVYIKAQGKTALIKNDLTKKIGNNEAKAEPNSYAYGVNTGLGMNFISNKDIFSPEIGLAYEGGYTEAFSMKDTIGQATVNGGERTYANYLNLFSTKTSFTWFRDWLPNLKTSVELGAKFNINPSVKAKARFGNIKVNDEFYLPRVQKFVSTSLIIPVNEAFYFSLNYNGMFDKDGNTHTGYAQFNYLW